jgi:hypothetical protein
VQAFSMHFLPDEAGPVLSGQGRGMLYCLYGKASD